MCQSAGLYSSKAGYVQCRDAKVCRQFKCHAFHSMPEYAFHYLAKLIIHPTNAFPSLHEAGFSAYS